MFLNVIPFVIAKSEIESHIKVVGIEYEGVFNSSFNLECNK